MKKQILIAVALALFATAKTQAQGSFTFGNAGGGVTAPISYYVNGVSGTTALCDATFSADFVYSATLTGTYVPGNSSLATPTTFRSTGGVFLGGKQTISDTTPASVYIEVRAWKNTVGTTTYASYNAANGNTWAGISAPVLVTLATGTAPVPPLTGLASFTLLSVPEPSTIALGVLGLSVLLFRRRQ
jgi:hypothetical protein